MRGGAVPVRELWSAPEEGPETREGWVVDSVCVLDVLEQEHPILLTYSYRYEADDSRSVRYSGSSSMSPSRGRVLAATRAEWRGDNISR